MLVHQRVLKGKQDLTSAALPASVRSARQFKLRWEYLHWHIADTTENLVEHPKIVSQFI